MTLDKRPAPRVRHAEVHYGDTLKRISLRELGDASRWFELVLLNGLKPPYIVAPEDAGIGLLAYGDFIRVPALNGLPAAADAAETYLRDLQVTGGRLQASNGDLALVEGIENLSQALCHRVAVPKRDLGFHPFYGCWVHTLKGGGVRADTARLAAFYVKSALAEDYRVRRVESCVGKAISDQIEVRAVVIPITGTPVSFSTVV